MLTPRRGCGAVTKSKVDAKHFGHGQFVGREGRRTREPRAGSQWKEVAGAGEFSSAPASRRRV